MLGSAMGLGWRRDAGRRILVVRGWPRTFTSVGFFDMGLGVGDCVMGCADIGRGC